MRYSEAHRALDLWGKRVRVWYRSERKWKTARVRWLYVDVPTRGKPRVYFQLTSGGKVNPWYYTADEIHPLTRDAPTGRRVRGADRRGK